ncbi:TPA: hypothetical protein N0F65_004411 [Lagenidium giganteum]|uniref:Peptidase S74 domain-containing protein n=1 Tax=Lagenidium giganteum TaxID=4803 RepID=A0AAV2ZJG4_9STRA|nr:TPA: hypothetical protein N0F65_004411 [Lagenidium giganteum]
MSLPPSTNSPIFNSAYFQGGNDYLTITSGDQRYLRIGGVGTFSSLAVSGNLDCGSLSIGGSSVDLSSLSGVTAGTVVASKLVLVDANKDITGFRNLTATTLNTTNLYLGGSQVYSTATELNYLSGVTPGITAGSTAVVTGPLNNISNLFNVASQTFSVLDGSSNISGIGTLSATTLTGTLSTAAQANVTSLGTLTSLTTSGLITTSFSNATSTLVAYGTWTNSSVPITASMQLSNIGVVLGVTTNHPLRLATNNTNRLYINESGQINVAAVNQTTYLFNIPGTCNITTPYIIGTQLTSTATELNTLAGVTAGTVSTSKALVVDSSKNLNGLNSLGIQNSVSATWSNSSVTSAYGLQVLSTINTATQQLGSAIAFSNDSAASNVPHAAISLNRTSATDGSLIVYTRSGASMVKNATFGSDKSLVLNSGASASAILTAFGSSGFTDGNYQRVITCKSDNATPLVFDIQIDSRDQSLDNTYAAFIGTVTLNDLKFGTNDSTKMCIKSSNGYVGIGTTSPTTPLEVNGSTSRTFDAGGLGYGQLSKTTTTFSIGPVTTNICATFANSTLLSTGSYYTTSDRRIKKNIEPIKDTTEFVKNVQPVLYEYRNDSGQKYLGYIAQEIAKYSIECINFVENENMKIEEEGDTPGLQMSVDYTKIVCLLHKAMQSILDRLDELEKKS